MALHLWRRELSTERHKCWDPEAFFLCKEYSCLGCISGTLGASVAAGTRFPQSLCGLLSLPHPVLRPPLLLLWGRASWSSGTTVEAPLHSESGEGLTHLTKPHSAPLFRGCLNWGLCFWRRSPSPALALASPSDNHMSKGERTSTTVGGFRPWISASPSVAMSEGRLEWALGRTEAPRPPPSSPFLASRFVSCLKVQ